MLLFLSPTGSVVTTAPSRTLFERLKSPNLVAELDAQRTPVVRLQNFLSAEEQARLHENRREEDGHVYTISCAREISR